MNELALARTMKRLAAWMDDRSGRTRLIQHRFEGAPFGNAYVSIAPGDDSPFASANHNRVHLCGTDGGLTRDGVMRLASLFDEAGVSRFFVWLSPGPDMEAARAWL